MATNFKEAKTPDELMVKIKTFTTKALKKAGITSKAKGVTLEELKASAIELAAGLPLTGHNISSAIDEATPHMNQLIQAIKDDWLKDPTRNILGYWGCNCCYGELKKFEQDSMPRLIEDGIFDDVYMNDPSVQLEIIRSIFERLNAIEEKIDQLLMRQIHTDPAKH